MDKSCINCKCSVSDNWHDLTCNNPESEEYSDYVDDGYCCDDWQGNENEDKEIS